MGDPSPRAHRRHDETRTRRRTWGLAITALIIIVALGAAWWYARPDLSTSEATIVGKAAEPAPKPLPKACADALALADLLATHVGPLSQAANDHVDVMERLELFLEGKPGGLNGHQAYERGEKQMAVMEEHGPDAQVNVKRYKQIRKGCPLQ